MFYKKSNLTTLVFDTIKPMQITLYPISIGVYDELMADNNASFSKNHKYSP